MKLPNFLFKNIKTPQWPQFPSCSNQQPKTSSFRAAASGNFNTINPSSLIIGPSLSPDDELLYSTANVVVVDTDEECIENVIHGRRQSATQRLFFKPDETKCLLEQATSQTTIVQNKSVVCSSINSINPYSDFKKSMEDMIDAHKLWRSNWDFLEDLLCWYLEVNKKEYHGHIISAFVDLVLGLSAGITRSTGSSSSSSCSPSSPLSSYTCSSNTINSTGTSCR